MQSCCPQFYSDVEFENAFREEFSPEDETYISVVIGRLRRILRWDSDEERHILDRRYGPRIIQEIFLEYLRWKERNAEPHAQDFHRIQHLLVFSLAKLSLFYWITDSRLVADILSEAYACDGHFSSMFAHIIQRHDRHSLLRHIPDSSNQREDSATIFFLHHAHKARLQFNGVRFQDLRLRYPLSIPPVFLAAIYNKPHLLLQLLRFGAKVEVSNRMPDDWNLSMLLRHLIRILWNALGEDLQHMNVSDLDRTTVMSRTIHQAAECVKILLRVIPQIRLGEINFLLMKFDGGILSGSVGSHDFIRQLSEKDIVPEFVNRYLEPSSLTHLCRCVIRNSLNSSWHLPYGIDLLPLPRTVKSYLSIARD